MDDGLIMDYLKKAITATLILLASPLASAAVAVDDFLFMDVAQDFELYFYPERNDSYDNSSFAGFSEASFELVRGEGVIEVLSDGPVFTPDQGYLGTAEIRYTISDIDGTDQGTVFIEVQNDAGDFQAVEDAFYMPENTGGTVTYNVTRNDWVDFGSDFPPQLTGTSGTTTQGGTVVLTPNSSNSIDYTPPSGFTGKDTFTYTLSNSDSGASSQATVTVYVGVEPQGDVTMPGNLSREEARTFAVVVEACQPGADNNLPCDEIGELSPEEQKQLAQQLSGRHAKLQARAMWQLQRQQSGNIQSRLREVRSQRNQISVDGLNAAILGESLPLGQVLQGVLRGGSAGDGELATPWGVFINGRISMGEAKETDQRPGYDQDGYDLTLGLDYRFDDTLVLGAASGIGKSDTDFTSMQGQQDARSFSLISFGNFYPTDNLYIDGLAMWTQGDLDVKRRIAVGSIQQNLSSDTESRQLTAAASVGYEFNHQRWQSSVYGRLEYSDLTIDGYTESGGSLALTVGEQSTHSFTSTLGTRIGYAFSWSRGVIVPALDLEYVKEGSDRFSINNQFADAVSAGSFTINAEEPDTEYMNLSFSASAVFSGGRSAFVRYETVLLQDSYDFSSYSVGFRTEF
jgi:uncharacterized protein with beta-barrel porin domain